MKLKKHTEDPTITPDPTAPGYPPRTAQSGDPGPQFQPPPDPAAAPTRPALDPPLAKPDRTRLGGLWIALTSGAVVLLLLLIFILENSQKIEISFFGAHGHLPLGVALLMAAIFGVLVVVIPGAGRMIQLRLLAKRQRTRAAALPPTPYEPAGPGTLAPHPDTDLSASAAGTGTATGTAPNPVPGAPTTPPAEQIPAYASDPADPNATGYHQ